MSRLRKRGLPAEEVSELLEEAQEEDQHRHSGKREINLLELERIRHELASSRCCKNDCLRDRVFTPEFVRALRQQVPSESNAARRVALASLPGVSQHEDRVQLRRGYTSAKFTVEGKSVCVNAFKRIYGISENLWAEVRHLSQTHDATAHEVRGDNLMRLLPRARLTDSISIERSSLRLLNRTEE